MTLSETSRLFIPLEIEENHLNQLISAHFKPIAISKQDKVTGMKLRGVEHCLTLELTLEGRYSGIVYAEFTPHIDNKSKKVQLRDLKIRLEESGLLSRGLNWVLHSLIKGKIEELVQSQLDKNLQKLVNDYLDKAQLIDLPQNLSAQLLIKDVHLHDFCFKQNILHVQLETSGTIKLLSSVNSMGIS